MKDDVLRNSEENRKKRQGDKEENVTKYLDLSRLSFSKLIPTNHHEIYKSTEWMRCKATHADCLVLKQGTSMQPWVVFSHILGISNIRNYSAYQGKSVPFFDHQRLLNKLKGKRLFFMLKQHFFYFILHPLLLVLSLSTTEQTGAVSVLLCHQELLHVDEKSLSSFPQAQVPALSAPPQITAHPVLWYHCGPFLDIRTHLVLVSQNWSQCSRCLTSAKKGLITSLDLLAPLFQAVQDTIHLLYCKGALLAHVQLVEQDYQGLFCKAALQAVRPYSVPVDKIIPPQVQGFAFPFVELHKAPLRSFLQLAQIPLNDNMNCVTYQTLLQPCWGRTLSHHAVIITKGNAVYWDFALDLSSWTSSCSS